MFTKINNNVNGVAIGDMHAILRLKVGISCRHLIFQACHTGHNDSLVIQSNRIFIFKIIIHFLR